MSNEFDAGKEADKIQQLAKEAIDESRPLHQDQALRKLEEEYLSLDQSQRKAVALALEDRNGWFSTLPSPSVVVDGQGNVTSITFDRSAWDVHKFGREQVTVATDTVSYGDSHGSTMRSDIPKQIKPRPEADQSEQK